MLIQNRCLDVFEAGHLQVLNLHHFQTHIFSKFIFCQQNKDFFGGGVGHFYFEAGSLHVIFAF